MNIPKLLLASAFALISFPAFSQADTSIGLRLPTQKGSWTLGTNLIVSEVAFGSINSKHKLQGVYNVSLTPRAGYFVKDNLMLGGMLNVSFFDNYYEYLVSQFSSKTVGLGVFARKYFGKATEKDGSMKRLRFFVEAGASYNKGRANFYSMVAPTRHETFSTGTLHVMPGVNYFFSRNVALEGGLHMSHTVGSDNVVGNANRIGINLGLQIFMGKR